MRKRSAAPAVSDATLSMMRKKILLTAVCCLTLTKTWTEAKKASIQLDDSVGQETVSRLYRNVPFGVYASASPYASFSFHVPTFASSPRVSQLGPVKQESAIVENTHGFLRDSYGNRFVESPQAYRTTFPQQYVQLQELPAHLAQPLVSATPNFQYKQSTPHFFGPPQFKVQNLQAASPTTAYRYAFNQPQAFTGSIKTLGPIQQQQNPTSNQAVFANAHNIVQFQNLKNVGKFQRLQESPNNHDKESIGSSSQSPHDKAQLKAAASTTSANGGKKAVINLVTKPPVPLLDLSLLEPLTFANPLVPQVQHFLPRINSVKYHKLPQLNVNEVKKKMKEIMIQSTKSYDSGIVKSEPNDDLPRKTQTKPESDGEDHQEPAPPSPTGTPEDVSDEEPEIVYEINSPNYKETYKEKVVRYNKETQSEPVHYNYEKKTEKEPVTYNYVHSSKEPQQVKHVYYESEGQNPEQLVYKFKPEQNSKNQNENHASDHTKSTEPSHDSNEGDISSHQAGRTYEKETHHHHERPEHRAEEYHHNSGKTIPNNYHHNEPQSYRPVQNVQTNDPSANYQPIITEYEEEIRVLPVPKQYATIKVNPNQHIQHGQVASNPNNHEHHKQPHELYNHPDSHSRNQHHPQQHIHEKPQQIITKEETPEKVQPNTEQLNEEQPRPEQDEESEEHFEEGYKNAAIGFPAYESSSRDPEKEIYNPDTYGRTQYHTDFDIEHSPFQQYQEDGDEYPKSMRSNYKDARDKTKEEYYLDYAISKPESLIARYRNKEDYYKMFKKQKPQYLFSEDETNNNNQKQSAKYTAFPVFQFHGSTQKPKQYFAKYKAAPHPHVFEYDYSKEAPKDNSAHATRPHQRLKTHTQFVEPQFQYGFEPSTLPRLLDSELSAMASNNNPESEKPGSRKKIFREKWYIQKTRGSRNADS